MTRQHFRSQHYPICEPSAFRPPVCEPRNANRSGLPTFRGSRPRNCQYVVMMVTSGNA